MINSFFIINLGGDIILEKHWKSVIHRSICDYFFDAQKRASNPEDVPEIISTPHHYLISIYRNQLYFVAVVTTEVPPLLVIEFLHRCVDTFKDYFEECSDAAIKEHTVIVFELLDEMLDNGFPLATESNILQELIKPPGFIRNLTNAVIGKSNLSETLPSGQLSNIPWRRAGVKYTNNEAYFDIIEEIDAIVDRSGSTVFAEIQGYVDCCIKLTGMPDLTLTFMNPRLLDDVSFHPCVRFKRWENERLLSFIPPDGNFRLMSYHIGAQSMVAIPIYVKHSIVFRENQGGKLDITVGPKQSMGKIQVTRLILSCQMCGRLPGSHDPAGRMSPKIFVRLGKSVSSSSSVTSSSGYYSVLERGVVFFYYNKEFLLYMNWIEKVEKQARKMLPPKEGVAWKESPEHEPSYLRPQKAFVAQ